MKCRKLVYSRVSVKANLRIKIKYVPEIYDFLYVILIWRKTKPKHLWHAAYWQMTILPFVYKLNEPMN